jgi:adenine-specific DNA-methyltransferase
MIYIDPPYNTGGDFVYKDDFKDTIKNYKEQTNQTTRTNPETSGRYHTDWLNMMYSRLMLAKNVLSEDGVIFVSIDEFEVFNLLKIMNEIFGENNVIENFIWIKNVTKNNSKTTSTNHEFVLCYSKNKLIIEKIDDYFVKKKEGFDEVNKILNVCKQLKLNIKECENRLRSFYNQNPYLKGITSYKFIDSKYRAFSSDNMSPPGGEGYDYEIIHPKTNKPCKKSTRGWLYTFEKFQELLSFDYILFGKDETTVPRLKKFLDEVSLEIYTSIINENSNGERELRDIFNSDKAPFENPKPTKLINYLLRSVPQSDITVLDFFSGSSTTAHAVMRLNAEDGGKRKFILVQLPEKTTNNSTGFKMGFNNICEIGKERIRRSGELVKKDLIEKNAKLGKDEDKVDPSKLDTGFKVFKLEESNFKEWDSSKEPTVEQLELFADPIKEGKSEEEVLYEVLLKYGVFDQEVKKLKINNKDIYSISDNYLVIMLSNKIEDKDIEEIKKLKPKVVIFRDSGFNSNDTVKINAFYNLTKSGVEEVKSV